MRKWIFRHPLLVDETERWLEREEANGLRLTCVKWGCLFLFQETRAKNTQYFISRYIQAHREIICCEYDLKRYCNADPVRTEHTADSIYRIPQMCDLTGLRLFRNQYFYFRFVLPLLAIGLLVLAGATAICLLSAGAERVIGLCLLVAAVLHCGNMIWVGLRLRRTILKQSGRNRPRELFDPYGVIWRGSVLEDDTPDGENRTN